MESITWGILGLGKIAHKFARSLNLADGAVIQAVGSRNEAKARAFASEYQARRAYGSYEDLVRDPEVEVVYVATPHGRHLEDVRLCLEAGKHVLCEKALALNLREVNEMIALARKHNCFLMEAIWTRFHPNFFTVKKLIDEGEIGPVRFIRADFGFKTAYDESSRLWDPELGGGSLLDIGIYPLFLALQLLGEPLDMQVSANLSPLGVDGSLAMQLDYGEGRFAQLFSSFETDTTIEAEIFGPEKRLIMHNRWHNPAPVSMWCRNECLQRWEFPDTPGYVYEILHVHECLRNGQTESSLLPLAFSQKLMKTMDEIRCKINVEYPADRE